MSIKRYAIRDGVWAEDGVGGPYMAEVPEGEFVTHDDHVAEVERLTRERDEARKGWNEVLLEVERLRAEVERLDGVVSWQAGIIEGHAEDMMGLEDARDKLRAEVARLTAERDDARSTVRHLEAELRVAKSHAASDRRSSTDERLKAERVTAERDGLAKAARDLVASWDWWQVDPYDREGPDLRYLRAALAALPTAPEQDGDER